jgi:hypothetical protein
MSFGSVFESFLYRPVLIFWVCCGGVLIFCI